MTNWEIHPFTGFGPLRFGQSRAEVRRHLGDDYLIFRKAPGVETETDSYNELGLHLYYDTEECLEFVEAFSPCEAEYSCVRVLRPSLRAVLKDLEELGLKHRYDDQGYFFDDMGFALFATGETVEGVSVYRKGYYDE